jgi:general nucleoside transport system permease protein
MRLVLEKRPEASTAMAVASPFIAFALTLVAGAIIFAMRGNNPLFALYVYFVEPLTAWWSVEQLIVKASPLILIATGLAIAYRANVWNIGAEGQLYAGAIMSGLVPVLYPDWQSPLVLLLMLVLGTLGGMAWGAIPAILRNRFRANEILTSLMLVYVIQLVLDYLVRGPWRDPQGFNFPKSITLTGWQTLPFITSSVHAGVLFSVIAAVVLWFMMSRTLKGFEVRVAGEAPRAARFAGFSEKRTVMFSFLLSGGLAGLAGATEVAGVINQLQPQVSPGYGFTAIIVAFLGRLNPIGVIFAGLLLALSYLGGESAQMSLGISDKIARVFQGILLFFILLCDTFILYRLRIETSAKGATA